MKAKLKLVNDSTLPRIENKLRKKTDCVELVSLTMIPGCALIL